MPPVEALKDLLRRPSMRQGIKIMHVGVTQSRLQVEALRDVYFTRIWKAARVKSRTTRSTATVWRAAGTCTATAVACGPRPPPGAQPRGRARSSNMTPVHVGLIGAAGGAAPPAPAEKTPRRWGGGGPRSMLLQDRGRQGFGPAERNFQRLLEHPELLHFNWYSAPLLWVTARCRRSGVGNDRRSRTGARAPHLATPTRRGTC